MRFINQFVLVLSLLASGQVVNAAGQSPSTPSGLDGSIVDTTVELTWDVAVDSDNDVEGYNVYRDDQYLTTVFTNRYVGEVAGNTRYSFSVSAFDSAPRNFSNISNSLSLSASVASTNVASTNLPGLPSGSTTPTVPSNLSGQMTGTRVMLEWSPSMDDKAVSGYNVYRNNDYITTVSTPSYTGSVSAGSSNTFYVTAFDSDSNFTARSNSVVLSETTSQTNVGETNSSQSNPSETTTVETRPNQTNPGVTPLPPTSLAGTVEALGSSALVRLSWTASVASVEVAGYNVFRDNRYIATVRDTQFEETLNVGQAAIYTVSGFDFFENYSPLSLPFTLAGSVNQAPVLSNESFAVSVDQLTYQLSEGNTSGVQIPVQLRRDSASQNESITLAFSANDSNSRVRASFEPSVLRGGQTSSTLTLVLDVDTLPIMASQKTFTVTASNNGRASSASVAVAITPIAKDDVYLLIGQSNMVGFSEVGARQLGSGQADEPLQRIRQANVIANKVENFADNNVYFDGNANFAGTKFVPATDPLHEPVDAETGTKSNTRIGLGLSFAKAALPSTTRSIVLVPAAWSGSGFCADASIPGQWNARPSNNSALGNTLLFDRALARINSSLAESGGILRGILWHQGEADSKVPCAPSYRQNLQLLVSELRNRINADARGTAARGASSDVPFVVGTMSRGNDSRGEFENFDDSKTTVDNVHRSVASSIAHSEVSLHDDLVPSNGFPCGESSCVHFGSAALREMGSRYYDALRRAANR